MASSSPSLMDKLTKELECSVCLEIYTNPKTLPCLHTFCRQCLNGLAERRENQEPIACPECKTEVALPEGGNIEAFPSFPLNRIRKILSGPREGNEALCNACRCVATRFCLDCEYFVCNKCHYEWSRLWVGHRLILLAEDRDVDGRRQLCEEPGHIDEALEFFCETCQQCICRICTIIHHKNHEFEYLDVAANQVKFRLAQRNKNIQDGVLKLEEQLRKIEQTNRNLEDEITAAELSVQRNTQRFIELAKRHEREVMTELAAIREERERIFQDQKERLERPLGQLGCETNKLVSVFMRGISGEILQAELSVSSRYEELLENVEELQPVRSERVKYVANEDAYTRVEQFVLGRVDRRRIPPGYDHVRSFGKIRSGDGKCISPIDIAVNSNGELAVADYGNTVQLFSSEGQFLRKFGTQGRQNGQLQSPSGVAYDRTGDIVVGDTGNARIQVFSPTGQWLRTFGTEVLKRPRGVSVTIDNNIVVCDSRAEKVFVFSPQGRILLQFESCPDNPDYTDNQHAIFHDQKYFVSAVKQVVRVFDARGAHLYDIGEGHLGTPADLAVDANNLLLVGDDRKACVRVFTLDGNFLTSFGSEVLRQGLQWGMWLSGIKVGPDERVFVCRRGFSVDVFQPRY